MTQGTPSWTIKTPRLRLQIPTTTNATTAIMPILISVRLAGGATRPLLRRRESESQMKAPSPATTTAAPIQETTGSMIPHMRL